MITWEREADEKQQILDEIGAIADEYLGTSGGAYGLKYQSLNRERLTVKLEAYRKMIALHRASIAALAQYSHDYSPEELDWLTEYPELAPEVVKQAWKNRILALIIWKEKR